MTKKNNFGEQLVLDIEGVKINEIALRDVDKEGEQFCLLRDSIGDDSIGLLKPISVRALTEDGETRVSEVEDYDGEIIYELVDGLQRFTACKMLGWDKIPAIVKDRDEEQMYVDQLVANLSNVETKDASAAKHLRRMLAMNPEWTLDVLAGKVHRSTSWVAKRFSLLKLTEEGQKLVDAGRIGLTNAVTLSKVPKEEQDNYHEQAKNMTAGEFAPVVDARIAELKEAAKTGANAAPPSFKATPKARKAADIIAALNDPGELYALVEGMGAQDAVLVGVSYCLSLDEPTLELRRQQWEAAEAKRAADKVAAKQARAKKAAENAAKAEQEAKEAAAALTAAGPLG